ncbi:MAG: malonyl-ACP O-methyltransferase BioC [Desulfobulbus sp.]|jgi:malonyl-ACP O-methyltransferase BioC|nr:malonyl-ACP O-methyltransferase BioC [Desulfobulbus sp.]
MRPDKQLIKLRFEQAAATYEQHAQVQLLVADRLLALLATVAPGAEPARILEIGCCTGLLTEKIIARFPALAHLTVSDLVDSFAKCVGQKTIHLSGKVVFVAGDIETVRLPSRYDLIISSSTLQWVHDLPSLCRKLAHHLSPGGTIALALYGQENMREIRAVTGLGLRYMDLEQLTTVVGEEFELLAIEQSRETLWFADAISVLHHLRATGVNAIGQRTWTRRQLNDFLAEYGQRFSGPRGVQLTYHPMYIAARPRS